MHLEESVQYITSLFSSASVQEMRDSTNAFLAKKNSFIESMRGYCAYTGILKEAERSKDFLCECVTFFDHLLLVVDEMCDACKGKTDVYVWEASFDFARTVVHSEQFLPILLYCEKEFQSDVRSKIALALYRSTLLALESKICSTQYTINLFPAAGDGV